MTANVANQSPYLRTSRNFPSDPQSLSVELSKSYVDIANVVNARTIGIYATVPTITGNTWYTKGGGQRNPTLRQVYPFVGGANPINIPHNINFNNIAGVVLIQGAFTDGTNWYPLPYTDVTSANNQINIVITPTNIVITAGGGSPPAIVMGTVVLEWTSQA